MKGSSVFTGIDCAIILLFIFVIIAYAILKMERNTNQDELAARINRIVEKGNK